MSSRKENKKRLEALEFPVKEKKPEPPKAEKKSEKKAEEKPAKD